MPTERFAGLEESKRKRIRDAVINEFQRTTYRDLQISKIAREAQVSRASLYTYFLNKEDLFLFAVQEIQKQDAGSNMEIFTGTDNENIWSVNRKETV